jgi:hypothetical protein
MIRRGRRDCKSHVRVLGWKMRTFRRTCHQDIVLTFFNFFHTLFILFSTGPLFPFPTLNRPANKEQAGEDQPQRVDRVPGGM